MNKFVYGNDENNCLVSTKGSDLNYFILADLPESNSLEESGHY